MKLLVIVLCLLSERYLIHAISYQRFFWFPDYCQYIKKLSEKNTLFSNPWALFTLIVLPILLVISIIYFLLYGLFFGFMGLLLSIILFFYCLGPQNVFYPLADAKDEANQFGVGDYFVQVNRQLFSVLFWYVIGGPIAALAYRLIALCRDYKDVSMQANQVADILEWIPARLTVLLFLLVGNFQRGFSLFCNFIVAKPDANSKMLRECGMQAVRTNETDEVPMPLAESLVEHATVVLLVFIALFTLISWL